nr:NTP transferase domain-containing protein [Acidiferrobacterales bacterium]
MNTKKNHTIAAIILSGGKGSRLGGVDKGLKMHNGKALVAWVIEAITPQVGTIVISINRNHEHYKEFNLATVFDQGDDEFSGPIA